MNLPGQRRIVPSAQSTGMLAATGGFRPGTAFTSVTPCDSSNAPSTCPAPPKYPANYLGTINLSTGQVSSVPVSGPALQPQGLLFAGG